jgi:superfamily II DNA or RNA helicase
MQLRDYQQQAIDDTRLSFRNGNSAVLLVAPTGAGKTVMFAHMTSAAKARDKRVYIIVHRMELVQQVSDKLNEFGVEHGFVARGRTPDPTQLVQVCMVQTLVKRMDSIQPPDFIVVDEAHHAAAGSWRKVLNKYHEARVLGVTATPERLDGKGLKDSFNDLVRGPEVADLINRGYLAKPRYFAPTGFSDENIRKTAGDYNKEDLEKAVNKSTVTGDAVVHYKRHCNGLPAVVFCVTIKHAEQVAAQFCAEGFKFKVIDGTLESSERKDLVKALASGELHGLCSCEIISEGFDLPVVTAAILLRPTASMSLYLQQVGRVLRPAPNKEHAIILDHVGNIHRHGLAEDYREWSLEGATWRKKREKAKVTNRQCPDCYCVHAPAPACPECGHQYKVEQRKLKAVDGELVEFTNAGHRPLNLNDAFDFVVSATQEEVEKLKADYPNRTYPGVLAPYDFWSTLLEENVSRKIAKAENWMALEVELRKQANKHEQKAARTFSQLVALGTSRGYKNAGAWARHVLAARGEKP